MSEDIVSRLNSSYVMLGDPLHKEAADEIERLRAALQEIAKHKISGIIPDDYNERSWTLHNYVEIREIARRARWGEDR